MRIYKSGVRSSNLLSNEFLFPFQISTLESNFTDEKLQECCVTGFSLIPMKRTCQERVQRVSLVEENRACAEVFLKCCLEGERLRQKKLREDSLKEFGRSKMQVFCDIKYLTCGGARKNDKTLLFVHLQLRSQMKLRSSSWTRLPSTSDDISPRALPSQSLMSMEEKGKRRTVIV